MRGSWRLAPRRRWGPSRAAPTERREAREVRAHGEPHGDARAADRAAPVHEHDEAAHPCKNRHLHTAEKRRPSWHPLVCTCLANKLSLRTSTCTSLALLVAGDITRTLYTRLRTRARGSLLTDGPLASAPEHAPGAAHPARDKNG